MDSCDYAVYVSGTDERLSEYMTAREARLWVKESYDDGETRLLVVR